MKLGLLYTKIRREEKLIIEAAEARGMDVVLIADEALMVDVTQNHWPAVDVVLDRSLAHLRAEMTLAALERWNIRTVNTASAARTCDNKILTDIALAKAGIPMPSTRVAYSAKAALAAIEELGYPVVIKPYMGSWGRLLAKINDREAAEAVIEHKERLGAMHHSIFYIQEYVPKPDRDIRVFVIGGEVVAAMYRTSAHWITNTALGGSPQRCEPTAEMTKLALDTASAVEAEIAGVDLIESTEGIKVLEINTGAEFHGLIETTEEDIPGRIVGYCGRVAG